MTELLKKGVKYEWT
jgi:hypothetical protein